MVCDDYLKYEEFIISQNRVYRLVFQTDGNLVLYKFDFNTKKEHPIWSSDSYGKGAAVFKFQQDGNLVIYKKEGNPLWSPNCHGKGGRKLVIQNDGNLVAYSDKEPIWHSNTYGK